MTKIVVAIVLVVGTVLAVVLFKNKEAVAPESSKPPAVRLNNGMPVPGETGKEKSVVPSTTTKGQTVIIAFANGTSMPNIVNIKIGDTVKFVNNDTVSRWPASGTHPIHQTCSGFDSLGGLNTGETYSFTFKEAKICPWHDHLQPSINGKIVVE